MKGDRIISALIGLAGACGSNPKTEATDALMLVALAFPLNGPEDGAAAEDTLVTAIHAEKNRIAPGCAACPNPCGNTADYEMSRLEQADEGVRRVKRQLIERLRTLAAARFEGDAAGPPASPDFFYKALVWLGCDLEEAVLRGLLREAEELEAAVHTGQKKGEER